MALVPHCSADLHPERLTVHSGHVISEQVGSHLAQGGQQVVGLKLPTFGLGVKHPEH